MSNKIGVILSGCGVYDGSEIHEAVFTLLSLSRAGFEAIIMAPNRNQFHVINHANGEVATKEERNILAESARIARGNIKDIKSVNANDIDALVIPGGFGAAKNLCNFAFKGSNCEVDPTVEELILNTHALKKPIVAICIAPALVMRVLTKKGFKPTITIGSDPETAQNLIKMGGKHENHTVTGVAVDIEHKIISTPAYMLAQNISEVADGIDNSIKELKKMLGK